MIPIPSDKVKTVAVIGLSGVVITLSVTLAYRELVTIPLLESDLANAQTTILLKESLLAMQNIAVEVNSVDAAAAAARVPIKIETVRTDLKPIYRTIYQWRDSNESDCNSSMAKLREFDFNGVFNSAMLAADR